MNKCYNNPPLFLLMSCHNPIPRGDMDALNAVIEVPRGCNNKYEHDKETGAIMLDRVLHSPFVYPADYGYIPGTLCDDGDPLDVLVLLREPSYPGVVVPCRPLGYLEMKDEKGTDQKMIAAAVGDPFFADYKDINDVPQNMKDGIAHFFAEYKRNEKGKFAEVGGWHGAEEAKKLVEDSTQQQ